VRLTVLGKSPSWQDRDGACSGYLLQEDGYTLLLDCGSGVFGKLRRFCDALAVDAVVLSHLHADHFLDLVPFSYALTYAPGPRPDRPPHLHGPPGTGEVLRRIAGTWGTENVVQSAFELREYAAADELRLGPFTVRFCPVPHYIPTFAVEVASAGRRLTYSADCAPNQALVDFAQGTELLLIEATLERQDPPGDRGHLTPREAGEHGARAGARRLVITHFTDELPLERTGGEARAGFGGQVELAAEGALYTI
jgi:ribonuclease BN (tRNA processing enzyme)